eukprot:CAMPEP_0184677580 /NCGR_PEP_ID=MMETSP0312-20130426/159_1 /TAXON_ID=31354 /ORGANISM="Compsopogon coeruleus, Strain SAG 36.94" /LENGTH=378 /DNA_ID=CAMNT_0027125521 /DNA_START=162 /DNA_END=1298 /DNA_ORIENTATION=-
MEQRVFGGNLGPSIPALDLNLDLRPRGMPFIPPTPAAVCAMDGSGADCFPLLLELMPSGERRQLSVPQTATVDDLYHMLELKSDSARLFFNGEELNPSSSLNDYNISKTYCNTAGILWAIEEGRLSLDEKLSGIESACDIARKVSQGQCRLDELVPGSSSRNGENRGSDRISGDNNEIFPPHILARLSANSPSVFRPQVVDALRSNYARGSTPLPSSGMPDAARDKELRGWDARVDSEPHGKKTWLEDLKESYVREWQPSISPLHRANGNVYSAQNQNGQQEHQPEGSKELSCLSRGSNEDSDMCTGKKKKRKTFEAEYQDKLRIEEEKNEVLNKKVKNLKEKVNELQRILTVTVLKDRKNGTAEEILNLIRSPLEKK